jgi:hypothetical protein
MKKLAKASAVFLTLMLFAPLSGGLAQTINPTWNKQIVDNGAYPSLAVDSNGNVHVTYASNTGLKYASWNGLSWSIQPVEKNASYYVYSSLALDSSGNPHISYCSDASTNYGLNYASWTGSAWNIQTVDSTGKIGSTSSLTLDSAGNPHISYVGDTGLKYAIWNGSTWNTLTVDQYGTGPALALDSVGNPHISYVYWDGTSSVLEYASWTDSTWIVQTVDQNGSSGGHLVLDSTGNPHINYAYYDSNPYTIPNATTYLKYASWTGSGWSIQTVDTLNVPFSSFSLALDSSGNPHIGYSTTERRIANYGDIAIKYAFWNGTTWNVQKIDSLGGCVSLVLDSNQNPVMCYGDYTNDYAGQLQIAYNGNLSFTPTKTGTQVTVEYLYVAIIGLIVVLAVLLLQRKRRVKKSKTASTKLLLSP